MSRSDDSELLELCGDDELEETIKAAVQNLVADFMYYGRKEDEDLTREQLNDALDRKVVTVESIGKVFADELAKHIDGD